MKNEKAIITVLAAALLGLTTGQAQIVRGTGLDLQEFRKKTNLRDVLPFRQTTSECKWIPDPYYIDNMDKFVEVGRSATAGNAEDQFILGLCYLDGRITAEDNTEGFNWLLKAAKQGHAGAQNAVATCYYIGEGVEVDKLRALRWFEDAGADGSRKNARPRPRKSEDPDHPFNYPARSEGIGDPRAKWILGWGSKADEAVVLWREAAEQGLYEAQVDLAVAYFWGPTFGVELDLAEAYKWITIAMVSGGAPHNRLENRVDFSDPRDGFGQIYTAITESHNMTNEIRAEGQKRALEFSQKFTIKLTTPQTISEQSAINYLKEETRKANKPGKQAHTNITHNADSRKALALAYAEGTVVPQNYTLAYKYLAAAIATTPKIAMGHYGRQTDSDRESLDNITYKMTLDQVLTAQRLAREWVDELQLQSLPAWRLEIQKEAEEGDPQAQRLLGNFYLTGEGAFIPDYRKGLEWLLKAAEQGEAGAQYDLGMIYSKHVVMERNEDIAKEWFLKSAQGGYSRGQYELSQMISYENGQVDNEWSQKAALQGNYNAQVAIGMYHLYNTQDNVEAYKWLNLTLSTASKRSELLEDRTTVVFPEICYWMEAEELTVEKERLMAMEEHIDLEISPSKESKDLLDHLLARADEGSATAKIYLEKDFVFLAGEREGTFLLNQFAAAGNPAVQAEIGMRYLKGVKGYPKNYFLGFKWLILAKGNLGWDDWGSNESNENYKKLIDSWTSAKDSGIKFQEKYYLSNHDLPLFAKRGDSFAGLGKGDYSTFPPNQKEIESELKRFPPEILNVAEELAKEWKPSF